MPREDTTGRQGLPLAAWLRDKKRRPYPGGNWNIEGSVISAELLKGK
jgi:hypothetical protein